MDTTTSVPFSSGSIGNNDSNIKRSFWQKFSLFSVYILTFLIPVFSLFQTDNFISLNKQAIIITLALLIFIGFLIELLNKGTITYPKNLANIFLTLFLIIIVISTLFSIVPSESLISISDAGTETLVNFFILAFIFFWLISFNFQKKEIFIFIPIFFASLTLFAIFNGLQAFEILPSMWNLIKVSPYNTNGLVSNTSNLLGFSFILSLGLILNNVFEKKIINYLLYGFSILSFLSLLIYNFHIKFFSISFSPAWLSLTISLIILISLNLGKSKQINDPIEIKDEINTPKSIRAKTNFFIFLLIIFVFLTFAEFLIPKIKLSKDVFLSYKESISIADKTSSESFKNLFIGSGPNTFSYSFQKYRSLLLNYSDFWQFNFNQSYSSFLTSFITIGILGIISFILFFIWTLKTTFFSFSKINNNQKTLAVSLTIPLFYLFPLLFLQSFNFTIYFFIFLFSGILISLSNSNLHSQETLVNKNQRIINLYNKPQFISIFSFIILILIALSGFLFYLLSQNYLGAYYFWRADQAAINNNLEQSEDYLTKAIKKNENDADYLIGLANISFGRLNQINQKGIPKKQEELEQNKQEFQRLLKQITNSLTLALQINNKNSQNWLLSAKFYESLSILDPKNLEKAKEAYQKTRELDPQNPSLPFFQAKLHFNLASMINNQIKSLETKNQDQPNQVKGIETIQSNTTQQIITLKEKKESELGTARKYLLESFNLKSDSQDTSNLSKEIEKLLLP